MLKAPRPLPEAEIQAPPFACLGQPLVVTASGGVQYNWGDGQTGAAIGIVPATLPAEQVSVTVINQYGCEGTAEDFIIVNPPPTATASADPPIICPGEETTLTAMGGEDYLWSTQSKTRVDCRERCFACGILPTFADLRRQNPGDEWQCPEVKSKRIRVSKFQTADQLITIEHP